MDLIPLEILSEIFAKLTLHDWLHCIQVCRSWRTIVPMAVDDLIICREECNRGLISQIHHFKMIRSATFRCVPAKSLCVALDRLSPCRINQLAIDQVLFKSMDDILRQHLWTRQLESLALIKPLNAELEIDLFEDILAVCPKLIHFSYQHHPRSRRLKIEAGPTGPIAQTNLVSLSLSTSLTYEQVVCLLQSSPGLQMLKLSFAKPIEPQLVLSFCPYMAYLHLGSFDWLPGSLEWSNRPIERGLRYLCLSNTSRSTTAFLSEHVATLEILHLPIVHLPISFPSRRLRVLSCDASQDRHGILDDLLLQGPSGIRELHLHHIIPTASLSRAIHRLAPTLTTLQLTVQYESDDMVLLEMLAFLPNLTTLSYQCQAISATKLETLAKVKSLQVLSVKSIEYAPLVSLTCLEELRVLRRIELWRMAYFSLEPLTHLEQLESIQLQWCVAPVGIRLLAEKAPRHLKKMGFEKCSAVSYEDIPDNVLVDRGISIVIE